MREVFEQTRWYKECFRESFLKCDPRRIVLGYKIGLVLSPIMKRIEEHSAQWLQYPIARARNLVWALLIQGVLNDERNLPDLLESYGCDLRKAADFKEYLAGLGTNKVYLPINGVLKNDAGYKAKINDEKYSFLRTKELFRRCMDEAHSRFLWTKRSF
jgi:hypothetical protein